MIAVSGLLLSLTSFVDTLTGRFLDLDGRSKQCGDEIMRGKISQIYIRDFDRFQISVLLFFE